MSILKQQENKLESLAKARTEFLTEVKQECNLNDEDYNDLDAIEDKILSGEIILEWFEHRDLAYIGDMIDCQKALIDMLKMAETGDKKALHNANKAFDELVHEARRIKKKRNEDIQKAQEVIALMDEIINICNEHRK
jgi:hypothetical protein